MNFVSKVITRGGVLTPLILNNLYYKGTGLFNPSVHSIDGKLLVNIRHCQYTIYHSEKNRFEHDYGPLVYLNPENDNTLTTKNYICELDNNYNIHSQSIIDTSKLDKVPLWNFIGLEDVRLVKWNDKLYTCGVRRDTTDNGQGRMELSELLYDNSYKEVSRFRIPAPGSDDSYCEKNWMPIVDLPYHFVKWSNPTEIVKFDLEKQTCESVFLGSYIEKSHDYRGGSQVISFGKYKIACVHIVDLYKSEAGRKNGRYRHCFVVWDHNWNVIKYTEPFSFMNGEIEFCAGMTEYNGMIQLSFGFQDNAAYLLSVPKNMIEEIISE